MKIKYISPAAIAAFSLMTATAGMAQTGQDSTPTQATHGLPPTAHGLDAMDHGRGYDDPGMQANRSGHGQGDADAMGDHRAMMSHDGTGDHHGIMSHHRCQTVWHHGHKVRRCR